MSPTTLRTGAGLLATAFFLVALAILAGGWFYAGEIREGALDSEPPAPPRYDVRVAAVSEDRAALAPVAADSDVTTDGVWGVRGRAGYGQVSTIERTGAGRVVRRYRHLSGSRPRSGTRVDVESAAFPGDPRRAFGLEYENVAYESDLGPTPAWFVPGSRRTWVLFVHGYNSSRRESLRLLGPVARAGFPALVISYRNDPGSPRTESGLREWGRGERRDLEGAVSFALEHGASDVALVGYSMGGAVVASFLYDSRLADRAVGAVLDAPALDLGAVIEMEARERRLPLVGTPIPSLLRTVAESLTTLRYGLDWDRVDYVERADELAVPALVLHGANDATVPMSISQAFADARPDLVTLLRFPAAGHVESWNLNPARYERRALAFLEARSVR